MFDKAKKVGKLLQQRKALEKELEQEVLEISHKGVTVRMNGNMRIVSLEGNNQGDEKIAAAINEGLKRMQKQVAKKMQGRFSELGDLLS